MNYDENRSVEAAEMRLRAEERLKVKTPVTGFPGTDTELLRIFHELQVHQIELEMQNEELRQTQEELELSRNTYAELFDFAPIGYFIFDASGVIRKVNLAGARLLGIERELMLNKPLISFIADAEGIGTFSHHLESVLQKQGLQRCEIKLKGKEGAVVYGLLKSATLDDVGSKTGYTLCSIVDGTVGKKLETEIQDAREYAENIVETVREPLVVLNSDLKILTANHSFYDTFKVTPEDTIGNFIYDLGNRQWDIPKLRVLFEEILPHDTVFNGYEVEHDFQGIGRKIILLNARQIFRKNIGSHIILLAMEDITERKQLEENLQNAHDKLELTVQERTRELNSTNLQLFQAQKMEAIGQLAGGIAHDFNNILTAIIGFSSLMEMHMDRGDPQRANVNQILAAADRAAELTRSLLAFSRKQIMNLQPVNICQIVKNIEKFLQRIIGDDIVIKLIIHQEVLKVNADCGQIEQVLMNLAVNARDAMPHGGMLAIEIKLVEICPDFITTHGYGEPGEYALVSLSDSGTGMDEITLKRLFEPFFTTKELGKGTGLGLSIVYGIIKQHNGYINVYSEPDVGTTFTIYLPLVKADINEKTEHVDEILRKGTETLLVADDDAALLDLTEKVLVQFGYTVITAVDGFDAVNKFQDKKESIALVILDVIMPKMNGKEALDEIRKIRPDTMSLFISGYTADIIHSRGMLDESLEFLSKPLRPMKLLQKVREMLDRTTAQ